eukprot:98973_1
MEISDINPCFRYRVRVQAMNKFSDSNWTNWSQWYRHIDIMVSLLNKHQLISSSELKEEKFAANVFNSEKCNVNLLDTFHYIIVNNKSKHTLQNIVPKCNIGCSIAERHNKNKFEEHWSDPMLAFWRDTLDSLHFYILHEHEANKSITRYQRFIINCNAQIIQDYEAKYTENPQDEPDKNGNRSSKNTRRNDRTNENTNDRYGDGNDEKGDGNNDKGDGNDEKGDGNDEKCDRNDDKGDGNDDKGDGNNEKGDKKDDLNEENETFLDSLYEYMEGNHVSVQRLHHINSVLETNEYDSDVLKNYLGIEVIEDSLIGDDYKILKLCVEDMTAMMNCFRSGYIFYYWEFYKETKQPKERMVWSQYKPHELYVKQKHKDIKDEILNNSICPLNKKSFNKCYEKTTQYMMTKKTKEIKATNESLLSKYNITMDSQLEHRHLLSIIFYCDCTKLCTSFSSTFREENVEESIFSVKKRNSEFANMARALRETVEIFGGTGIAPDDDSKNDDNTIKGPFYCGVIPRLPLESFNIRLCCPTSTSSLVTKAWNFGKDDGMVIQFNNNGHAEAHQLRIFDCSWISNYKHEKENVFMGGFQPIKVETILMKNNGKQLNYEVCCNALFDFDCMLQGTIVNKPCGEKSGCIINELIKQRLGDGFNGFDKFVNDCFTVLVLNKTQITLHLEQICTYFKGPTALKDLLFDLSIQNSNDLSGKQIIIKQAIKFNYRFCNLFKNVKKIIIESNNSQSPKIRTIPRKSSLSRITNKRIPLSNANIF